MSLLLTDFDKRLDANLFEEIEEHYNSYNREFDEEFDETLDEISDEMKVCHTPFDDPSALVTGRLCEGWLCEAIAESWPRTEPAASSDVCRG